MAIKKTEERSYDGIAPKVERVTEELMTKLNDVEWNNRASELAEASSKSEETELHRKNVMADLGADVKAAKAKVIKLAHIVGTRSELREVTVEVTSDYEAGKVVKKRTDTGEVISEREMTTMERQGGLFDELDDEPGVTDADDFIAGVHEDNKDVNTKAPASA